MLGVGPGFLSVLGWPGSGRVLGAGFLSVFIPLRLAGVNGFLDIGVPNSLLGLPANTYKQSAYDKFIHIHFRSVLF